MTNLEKISQRLSRQVSQLEFPTSLTVYNPLDYAWKSHSAYLRNWGQGSKEILFLGLNPGPFGMAQVGIPFGEISKVKNFLRILEPVDKPVLTHPKRPIEGFDCKKSEMSGKRFWSWIQEKFEKPEIFFQRHFVWNFCPLVFMEKSGKNITPDKLSGTVFQELEKVCGATLETLCQELQIKIIIGLGRFAQEMAKKYVPRCPAYYLLHPSPSSPLANKGWSKIAEQEYSKILQTSGLAR